MNSDQPALPGVPKRLVREPKPRVPVTDALDQLTAAFLRRFPKQRKFGKEMTAVHLNAVLEESEMSAAEAFRRIRYWGKVLDDAPPWKLKEVPPKEERDDIPTDTPVTEPSATSESAREWVERSRHDIDHEDV